MIKMTPSLLAADLMNLGREIETMLSNGIDRLHFDVMDAHFVPNLSFGTAFCREIHKRFPQCLLDVHLMMDNPEEYLDRFIEYGAYSLTVHQEAVENPAKTLDLIRQKGVKAGLSIKPGTKVEALSPYLPQMDQALIMTVEPGFGGQKFMPEQVEKIRALRRMGFSGDIAVDGGVNLDNAKLLMDAGATLLVMGTAYFRAPDPSQVAKRFKELT